MADTSGSAGHDARMYYSATAFVYDTSNVTGDRATNLLALVRTATPTADGEEIDLTSRDDFGSRKKRQGLKSGSVEVELTTDESDAGYQVFKNAYINGTILGVEVLGALKGSQTAYGPAGNVFVSSFSPDAPLEGGQMTTMTLTGARAMGYIDADVYA